MSCELGGVVRLCPHGHSVCLFAQRFWSRKRFRALCARRSAARRYRQVFLSPEKDKNVS